MSIRQTIKTRLVAIVFIAAASLSTLVGFVVISAQWSIKGNNYLNMEKINNETAALWCVLIFLLLLSVNGGYTISLLLELNNQDRKLQ